eukprot:1144024-Lingulodinium_polyedra.AAC.1
MHRFQLLQSALLVRPWFCIRAAASVGGHSLARLVWGSVHVVYRHALRLLSWRLCAACFKALPRPPGGVHC